MKDKTISKEALKKYAAKIDLKRLSTIMLQSTILYAVIFGVVSIFFIFILYVLIYENNLPTIPSIIFEENKWLVTDNLKIINSLDPNYAIIGDQLTYRANFTNISNSPLTFTPKLQINSSGDVPIKISYDSIYLNTHQNVSRTFDFSLTHEGSNKILLTFEVINQSNGNYIGNIRSHVTISGLSLSNKLQHDSNSINLKNSIATSVIGVTTVTALIISYMSSRTQTNIAKKQLRKYEQELRNRIM